MTNINIEISDDVHKQIKIACAINGITLKEFVNTSIVEFLAGISKDQYEIKNDKKKSK